MSTSNPQSNTPKRAPGFVALAFFVLLLIAAIVLPIYNPGSLFFTIFSLILSVLGVFFSFVQAFPGVIPRLTFPRVQRSIALLALALILSLTLNAIFFSRLGPILPRTPTPSPSVLSSRSVATPTSTSNITSTSSSSPPAGIAYDFEGSTTGWDSSFQNFNPYVQLSLSTEQAKTGRHSLKVMTRFLGDTTSAYKGLPDQDAKRVYTFTDAKVYFTQEVPQSFSSSGPFNFVRKQLSCFVFLPSLLLSGGNEKAHVELYVKDTQQRNAYSKPTLVTNLTVGMWIQLTLTLGDEPGGNVDNGFDGTQVIAVGVLFTVLPGSTLDYTGPFYIDDVVLPH